MKKLPKYLSSLPLLVGLWGAFLVPSVFAQSGHFVIVQQSQVPVSSTYLGINDGGGTFESNWFYKIGNGWVGTSTNAFVTAQYTISSTASNVPALVEIREYTDSGYSSFVGACSYAATTTVGTYPVSAGFLQLDPTGCSSSSYVFNPAHYYSVEVVFTAKASEVVFTGYWGDSVNHTSYTMTAGQIDPIYPGFAPQFAIVGGGFQITPSASNSGLFLSGAQEFCNSAFGTSTAGVFGIITDLPNALCQVTGYLFIPTQDSLGQFAQIPSNLLQRFPFSWYSQMQSIFSVLTASSTVNYPTISYAIGPSTPGYINIIVGRGITIANPTTIQALAPDSAWTLIRFLISTILWITFAYFIYRTVQNIWHVNV